MAKFHRAFGVYGIIGDQDGLVVTKKYGGPYTNRFDLPGGSLGDGEPLLHAIKREIQEETGLVPTKLSQLGITSFRYPWHFEQWQYNQHICVFYRIDETVGQVAGQVSETITGQDSHGALRVPLSQLSISNASPLVLKVKAYLLNHETFDAQEIDYQTWTVLKKSVY
ncbi:NUDIX hydrolase [Lactiplantibacillus daowaiensis]|uniref:NUDIX hydrolase n=1 Tax=Lactiplantibacillus daowaiensis TaxID=2559918 RepID=A0ABW1S128_9LACO|nr:NUDIX hydrolase [Lactiplantibacillus daowaiensis]